MTSPALEIYHYVGKLCMVDHSSIAPVGDLPVLAEDAQ